MRGLRPADTESMAIQAVRHRPDVTPAEGAMESLERVLGEHWGRAIWVESCRRAGVSPGSAPSADELRLIARELGEVPGPASVIGRVLSGHVTVYESLTKNR